jgi:type I restriction enzyme S subunit
MENNLPQGWAWFDMLNVIDYEGGSQPPKKVFIYEPKKGYVRLIQIRDYGEKPFPTYVPDSPRLKKVKENDLLIARYGGSSANDSLGRICSGIAGAYNVALAKVIFPRKFLNTSFIRYLFSGPWFKERLNSLSRSCQTGFNREDLQELFLPLPPLPEQDRIVAKLDAVMQKVESNKQRLEKIPKLLKRFRQSVLAASLSGKLTEGWREKNVDLESGEILLSKLNKERKDKYKKDCELAEQNNTRKPQLPRGLNDTIEYEIDEAFVIPNTWSWSILDKISTVALGGTPSRKISEYWNGDINWVSSGEVANNRITITREKITLEGLSNSNTKIYPKRTVLLAMIGEGKTRGQVSILNIEVTTNQNVAGLLLNNDFINSEYVWYFLLSRYESLRDNGLGGAQPALNGERVGQIPIAIPPHEEQKEIVRRVEQLFAFADKIEARYTKAKVMLDKLPQSILAKAFRGELVPQNPNDEPASILLKRIKAEKEKLAKEKESKKSKKAH